MPGENLKTQSRQRLSPELLAGGFGIILIFFIAFYSLVMQDKLLAYYNRIAGISIATIPVQSSNVEAAFIQSDQTDNSAISSPVTAKAASKVVLAASALASTSSNSNVSPGPATVPPSSPAPRQPVLNIEVGNMSVKVGAISLSQCRYDITLPLVSNQATDAYIEYSVVSQHPKQQKNGTGMIRLTGLTQQNYSVSVALERRLFPYSATISLRVYNSSYSLIKEVTSGGNTCQGLF
jgi:hypothetical protein